MKHLMIAVSLSAVAVAGGVLLPTDDPPPLIPIGSRCAVPLPEGEGIGGHALGSLKQECNIAPVDQFQAPQKLL
jgi:hypothetical protein